MSVSDFDIGEHPVVWSELVLSTGAREMCLDRIHIYREAMISYSANDLAFSPMICPAIVARARSPFTFNRKQSIFSFICKLNQCSLRLASLHSLSRPSKRDEIKNCLLCVVRGNSMLGRAGSLICCC